MHDRCCKETRNIEILCQWLQIQYAEFFSGLVSQQFVYKNRCTDMCKKADTHTHEHTHKTTLTHTAVNRKSAVSIKAKVHHRLNCNRRFAVYDSGSCFLSQDTVVALQALSAFAALGSSHDFDLTIRVNADASTTVASFHIRQDNYLLQQSQRVR